MSIPKSLIAPWRRRLLSASLLGVAFAGMPLVAEEADGLTALAEGIQVNPSASSEADVLRLVEKALAQGRPLEASTAVDTWLSNNFSPSPALLLAAARNAKAAGSLRSAAERYASYLDRVEPGRAESHRAAVEFLRLTIDLLGDENAAYQFILRGGLRLRGEESIRRFDGWLINEALTREDLATAIASLEAMFKGNLDRAIARLHYQPMLRRVAQALAVARQPTEELADRLLALAGSAQLDDGGTAEVRFYAQAARLAAARLAGEEERVVEYRKQALDQGIAWIRAVPLVEVYRSALRALAHDPHRGRWSGDQIDELGDGHARMVLALLDRASESEQRALFAARFGRNQMIGEFAGTPLQWHRLGTREARLFVHNSFNREQAFEEDPSALNRQINSLAGLLGDTRGSFAVALRALHAGGGDPARTAEAFFGREAWRLDGRSALNLWNGVVQPVLAQRMNSENGITDAIYAEAIAPWVSRSIGLRFDRNAMRNHLRAAFQGNRAGLDRLLEGVSWIPLTDDVRNRGSGEFINRDFRDWQRWVQRTSSNERDRNHEAAQALVPLLDRLQPLVDAFAGATDINFQAAPDPLLAAWATAVQAGERNQHQQAAEALKRIAGMLPQGPSAEHPSSTAVLDDILGSTRWNGPAYAAQLEVLQAALRGWRNEQGPHGQLLSTFMNRTRDWWGRTHRDERDAVLAANVALSAVLEERAEDGYIPMHLLNAFRNTRRGRDWREQDAGADLITKLLDSGKLWASGMSAVEAMDLVRNDFPNLRERFPLETWFDNQIIKDAQASGRFDAGYWEHGRDPEGKVRRAAFEQFGGALPPLAEVGSLRAYERDDYEQWMRRLFIGGRRLLPAAALERFEQSFEQRPELWAIGLGWFRALNDEGDLGELRRRASAYSAAVGRLPIRAPGIELHPYRQLSPENLETADINLLFSLFTELQGAEWPSNAGVTNAALHLVNRLRTDGDEARLRQLAPALWSMAETARWSNFAGDLLDIVRHFVREENTEMIAAFGGSGVAIAQEALNANQRRDLESIVASARSVMGPVISVPPTDPSYPILAAQQNWSIGRNQGAWEMLARPQVDEVLRDMVGELNPQFLLWATAEMTRRDVLDRADMLSRALLTWMDSVNVPLPAEFRAETLLQRARIAMRRGALPVARAQFRVIAEDEAFVGLPQRSQADLLTAEVDRLSGRFEEANEILQRLARSADTVTRANALFFQAKIRKDQEDVEAARRLLDSAMALYTNLEMVFFQKELQLARRDFMSARRWGWGSGSDRIVAGRNLEIAIEDRNRVIAQNFSSIELRVWTEVTGDEETLILTMADDRGELFTGELPTELGPARQGDRRLQVVGGDRIHYDLSESFIRRVNFERTGPTEQVVRVVSDGELIASSGTILSREERQRQIEEALFRPRQQREEGPLSERRAPNQVRPGNPINVQVIDPSRSTSLNPDRITVQVNASSGDVISAVELMETGSSSGVFEGSIPTDRLPARAFASDTAAGSDPNVVISPSTDLPPWSAATGSEGPRFLAVDFNDLVEFKELVIEGDEQRRVRRLVIEESLNNQDYRPLAAWPDNIGHWRGEPEINLVPLSGQMSVNNYGALTSYLERSSVDPRFGVQRVAMKGDDFALRWDDLRQAWSELPEMVPGAQTRRRGGGDDAGIPILVRARSAFWVDERSTHTFFIEGTDRSGRGAEAQLFINGRAVTPSAADVAGGADAAPLSIELGRGLHVLELVQVVGRNQGNRLRTSLRAASAEPPYVVPVGMDFFDTSAAGPLLDDRFPAPARVSESGGNNRFVVDLSGRSTRTLRAWFMDVEGGVPSIRKWHATDIEGNQLLPLKQDFDELRRNQILEIGAGDRITITYNDPTPFNDNNAVHEVFLSANYHNASVTAAFPTDSGLAAVRRFEPGDAVRVLITDFDADRSPEPDVITYTLRTSSGVTKELQAIETGPHTGVFLGAFFPVTSQPQRDSEVQVVTGDDITIIYRDQENTDPGIPWDRLTMIEQVTWHDPQLRVASTHSQAIPESELEAMLAAAEAARARALPGEAAAIGEVPRYRLIVERPSEPVRVGQPAAEPAKLVLGSTLQVEVLWPTIAKSTASRATIYAQTSTGRKAAGLAEGVDFDLSVPGTVAFEVPANSIRSVGDLPDGHIRGPMVGPQLLGSAMDQGAFTALIPVRFGNNPNESLVDRPDVTADQQTLLITANDTIYVGFNYEDAEGRQQWLTQRVVLGGSTLFDVYDRSWDETVSERYVGEQLYLQATDPLANISSERDRVKVEVTTESGWSGELTMVETLSHSGIFRTVATFIHEQAAADREDLNAIPVTYGDTVRISYPGRGGTVERVVRIHKGADGVVVPFSKRFHNDHMAMGTLFSIAEAYFELAKQQRRMAEDAANRADAAGEARFSRQVRDSIDAGRNVLEDAIRQFPESALRAQADYLMAELELEFAADTESEDDKRRYFENALQRFAGILAGYPDSEYAPRAQYKLGLVYEEMGEMTAASQEYVKLSFRWPDHELVADAMIRLARHFQREGQQLDAESQRLSESDPPRSQVLARDSRRRFATAGDVLTRLVERFPTHPNAAAAGVAAGTNYLNAHRFAEATAILESIANDNTLDAPLLRAEALYWLGDAYLRMMEAGAVPRGVDARGRAEIAFTTCTVNYPESVWARRSRGMLDELSRRRR